MSTAPRQLSGPVAATVAIAPTVGGVRLAPRLGPTGRRGSALRAGALAILLVALTVGVLVKTGKLDVKAFRLPWTNATVAAAVRPEPARGAEPRPEPRGAPDARPPSTGIVPASTRVVPAAHASALFASHSWYVPPPPPPAAPPPPPPPEPTAPPLPYTLVGSYAPQGEKPVYFLANKDRVIDAHVGDQFDDVYQLESAAGDQLVFVYKPLNIRQTLAPGQSPAPKGTR